MDIRVFKTVLPPWPQGEGPTRRVGGVVLKTLISLWPDNRSYFLIISIE